MLRSVLMLGGLLLLTLATIRLWQHRFEVEPGAPVLHLDDFQPQPAWSAGTRLVDTEDGARALELEVGNPVPRILQRLSSPELEEVRYLLTDFQLEAANLQRGRLPWEDGRFMLEWHRSSAPSIMQPEYLASVRHETNTGRRMIVSVPPGGAAFPVLRLEHLGASGTFALSHLRVAALRDSKTWQFGFPVLSAAWLAWFAALVRPAAMAAAGGRAAGVFRALAAAAVAGIFAYQTILPGPWPNFRPFCGDFTFTERLPAPETAAAPPPEAAAAPSGRTPPAPVAPPATPTRPPVSAPDPSAPPPPASPPAVSAPAPATPVPTPPQVIEQRPFGKLAPEGTLILQIKEQVRKARWALHLALLLGPTLVLVLLIGRRWGVLLSSGLALSIELAQIGFGYEFDAQDAIDLACDAAGIWLAALVARQVAERFGRWREKRSAAQPA